MVYTDCNSIEFNSLTSIVRPIEESNTTGYLRPTFNQLNPESFVNSRAAAFRRTAIPITNADNVLSNDNYILYLNKIEREHILINSIYSLNFIKSKFAAIYSDLVEFRFDKMSVELTSDNSLIFSLNKNDRKFLLQYFLDFDPSEEDDVEIIFYNQSNVKNILIEARYTSIKNIISEEISS